MKRFVGARMAALLLCLVALTFLTTGTFSASAHSVNGASRSSSKITIWLQTMDSCRQAIPGPKYVLTGNGLNLTAGPAPGSGLVTVGSGSCPIQRGNCATVPTGCVSWTISIPSSTLTYKIKETLTPSGFVPCTGGSVCPAGPDVIKLTITSSGHVSATVKNTYPDGTSVTWPTSGSLYTATRTDPIVVHNFRLGTGSCDGDHDADDRLTGSPSSHCDSDGDHH
ncbi:MAG TPA: hypothetical protein VEU97_04205 [Ktedonobacteraceae bacterium]|nr:hypothetical protein [Ktedonobacteraceae bacterium]